MYITQLIIDINTEIRCDSMCVVWGVCLGCITKHKTIFNLILSVEIYSWSQDKALSKKLTGHFGSWEYKTLNPNLAKHWTPRNSELHTQGPFPGILPVTFSRAPGGLRSRKPLISKCWGRKWWPFVRNGTSLSTHFTFGGGLEARAGNPLSTKAGRMFLGHANKPAGVSESLNFPDWCMMGSVLLLQKQGALPAPWLGDLAL